MIFLMIITMLFALVFATPMAWLLMLFLGNLGVHIGFWGCLPGAVLIGMITNNVETKR